MSDPNASCPIALDESKLDRWLAGELPEPERRELTTHMMTCAACRAEKGRLERERALFAERATKTDPEASMMWDKISPLLVTEMPLPHRSRGATWAGALVAVAAGLMLMVRFGGVMNHGTTAKPPVAAALTPSPESSQGAALPTVADRAAIDVTVKPGAQGRAFFIRELPGTVHWEFQSTEQPHISVHNVSGVIKVRAISKQDVSITAVIEESDIDAKWKLEIHAIDSSHFDAKVYCDGLRCDDEADVELDLDVPIGAEVSTKSVSGDVEITGGIGKVQVDSVSGDVTLDNARNVTLRSTSGDVQLHTASSFHGDLQTVSGDINWDGRCGADCDVKVHTVSGDAFIDLAPESSYDLSFHTVSGEGPGTSKVGAGAGKIRVQTVSGDLRFEADLSKEGMAQ